MYAKAVMLLTALVSSARSFSTTSRYSRRRCFISSSNGSYLRMSSSSTAPEGGYPFASIEPKWQKYWDENNTFKTPERDVNKEKMYILDMFPYPSGAGLHVGHPEGYTASDIMARYYRMKDFDVLHPIGWDSFGLPAEQYAIQNNVHPEVTTKANIKNFKRQLKMLGFSYDWDREIATTDVDYVKWTQWIFLQLFHRGLASQSSIPVNWCPALGTVLANEEIINGKSERGDHDVLRLPLRQWELKITEYAEKLVSGLDGLDWPSGTKVSQEQWIGKSVGTIIEFSLEDESIDSEPLSVFTTRADTILGVTFITLAPEHPLLDKFEVDENVRAYIDKSINKSDLERTKTGGSAEKTGEFTGYYAKHPMTSEKVPIYVGDYVLGSYGSGAVMGVPAHDSRDWDFADVMGLDKKFVVSPSDGTSEDDPEGAFIDYGVLINSGEFDGLTSDDAKTAITSKLSELNSGGEKVQYKLRDWVFSRQRYWGEPIPIYFPINFKDSDTDHADLDPKVDAHEIDYDTPIAVSDDELPLKLPDMDDFKPGDDPAGCLARNLDWRYFMKDGKWYARETNTMPQWAGSCWYYLRFLDPKNCDEAFSKLTDEHWMPVDLYIGGSEHAVLHLLYARFWHQVMYDAGYTKHSEPFKKLVHQGMILGSDGEKMSKSRGNVVNPDDIVSENGADALRMYEMFMGPLEAVKPWQTEQVTGIVRFINKLYRTVSTFSDESEMDDETKKILNKTIKKVSDDIESLSFNTAISALMVLTNHLGGLKEGCPREAAEALALMVSPFAPHLGEECWSILGHEESLSNHSWVEYDEKYLVDDTVKMGVQINGKKRGEIEIKKDASQEDAIEAANAVDKIQKNLDGKNIIKVIFVPGRILNIVAK